MSTTDTGGSRAAMLRRPSMGWGSFAIRAIGYLVLTHLAAAVLIRGYKIPITFDALGVTIPPLLYLVAAAFVAYRLQSGMSAAYGGGRFVDFIVSIPMLAVVVVAVLMWIGLPPIAGHVSAFATYIGFPPVARPDEYMVAGAILFGLVALYDVVGRDIFGFGRRSALIGGYAVGSVDRREWTTGDHGELPDKVMELRSRSGMPEIVNEIPVRHVVTHYFYDPKSGQDIRISGAPTPRGALRVADIIDGKATRVEDPKLAAPGGKE